MPSLSILQEHLFETGFVTFGAGYTNVDIRAPRYPTSADETPDAHDILLVDDASVGIVTAWGASRCRAAICIDKPTAGRVAAVAPKARILIAPQSMSILAVQQAVWNAIFDYEEWIKRLMRSALRSDSLSSFLGIIGEKLNNPLAVFDNDFNILSYSETARDLPKGTVWDSFAEDRFKVAEFYDARERANISRAIERSANKEILFHPQKDPGHTYYSGMLRVNGRRVGCIGIADVFAPLSEGQIELARVARGLLETYLSRNLRALLLDDASRGLWFDLITGREVKQSKLQEMLEERGWRYNDSYTMMSFAPAESRRSSIELAAALHQVAAELPLARIAVEGQEITALIREADYGDSFCANPAAFLKQSGLYAGLSFQLPNLSHCAAAFRQSTYAVQCARKLKVHLVDYSSVVSQHVAETLAQSIPIETFCHPQIVELAKSPKASDRELVSCLRSYLLNGKNIAETARSLHLHRNTVIYRVRKLSRLLNVSFAEMPERELLGLLASANISLAQWRA